MHTNKGVSMDVMHWIVVLLVVFLVFQYLVGPILVYFNQKLPESYRFKLLESEPFLEQRGRVFQQLHQEICESGFRYVGSSEMHMSHSALYFSVYYSEPRKLSVLLMTAHAENTTPFTQIEFVQLYRDGSLLSVSNNGLFSVYPEWDIKQMYRFPQVNDFTELLQITDRLIGKYKTKSVAEALPQGEEFSIIEAHLNDEMAHLVEIGWVSPVVRDHERGLTFKGAVLMTWKMCWPVKILINKIDVNRSLSALENA
ncbi:MAG: hypothetical protein ABW101_05195 [Candidatus Thiodiazotropha sp.]